jgi:hypothetical protein
MPIIVKERTLTLLFIAVRASPDTQESQRLKAV